MNDDTFYRLISQQLTSHFDASETAFLLRQVEQVRTKTFEVDYPELKARNFFPLATDIAPSATSYVWFVYDKVGSAKIIANGVDDLPRVEVNAAERDGKVRSIGNAYGWDIIEMREAARLGMPLKNQKALAASYFIAAKIDSLLGAGDTAAGIPSFISNADIADGAGATDSRVVALTFWVQGTTEGQDMLDDLNKLSLAVPNGSSNLYYADTILLPPAQYNMAATTRMNDFDQRTVLQAFLAGNPWIKSVDYWGALTGAGASAKHRAIAFKRSPDVVEAVVPQEFEELPPEARNLEFVINCHARCGGTKVYKPLAVAYGDFPLS